MPRRLALHTKMGQHACMQAILWGIRRAVMAAAAASFVIIFSAFLQQLYGAPPAAPRGEVARRWRRALCAAKFASLQLELQEHFAQAAAGFDQPLSTVPSRRWFCRFEHRLEVATEQCAGDEDPAVRRAAAAMGVLHQHFSKALGAVTYESTALRAALHQVIDATRPQ